jgi:uracil-DNA glycosylase family 4
MQGEGEPGGLLLVSDYPGEKEDRLGRPFVGKSGQFLRYLLRQYWKGPIAIDNALRCKMPRGRKPTETMVKQCRPYLRQTLVDADPQRIVAMGAVAAKSITGRAVRPLSVRKGYTWITDTETPVFFLMNPAAAVRNRFMKEWFEEDLKWALSVDIKKLRKTIPWDGKIKVVRTQDDVNDAHEEALSAPWIMYDTETAGRMFEDGTTERVVTFGEERLRLHQPAFRVLCVSICPPTGTDVWMWDAESLADPVCAAGLKRIMEDPKVGKAAHHEKFDRNALWHLGIHVRGFKLDSQYGRKIQDPEVLKRLEYQQELAGMGGGKRLMAQEKKRVLTKVRTRVTKKRDEQDVEDILEELGPRDLVNAIRFNMADKPDAYIFGLVKEDILLQYNAIDTRSAARVGAIVDHRFRRGSDVERGVRRVWEELIRPVSEASAQMERWGVAADRDNIEIFQTYVQQKYDDAKARIRDVAGEDFDPGNRNQLIELLYKRLKLPVLSRTKKSNDPATDAKTLDRLKSRHPLVEDIMLYKKVEKNKGTYADSYANHIRSDGRIHPSLNLDGARSGRTSMENPNLQQVPRADSPEGKMARDCFTVPDVKKYVMVQFDFSQLEYRVAADLSGDPEMLKIYKEDPAADLHMRTAQLVSEMVWGIPPDKVTKKERSEAKCINFGTLYGMGDAALAAILGTDSNEARRIKKIILGKFKVLDRWCKSCLKQARSLGGVWTDWAGDRFRFRPLHHVGDFGQSDEESSRRSIAEHGSWNTPVQGKSSDYCLFSLADCVQWIKEDAVPAKLVLTVHDSLIFEVRKDALDEVLFTVPEIMTSYPTNNGVPLIVDAEVGPSWGSLEKV